MFGYIFINQKPTRKSQYFSLIDLVNTYLNTLIKSKNEILSIGCIFCSTSFGKGA